MAVDAVYVCEPNANVNMSFVTGTRRQEDRDVKKRRRERMDEWLNVCQAFKASGPFLSVCEVDVL